MRKCVLIAVAFATNLVVFPTRAQDYPSRPVRIISGLAAGTAGDITARLVGSRMGQILGQQFVVENRPGAGSSLGAAAVARAPADGYTLLSGAVTNVMNAAMNPNLTFDFVKDFAPVALLTTTPVVLAVHPSVGVNSVKELVELAKARPNSLAFGSGGANTATHLAIEMFKVSADVQVTHVPYSGSPQAVTDLLAGRIQAIFTPASTVMQYVHDGRLIALASTEAKRTPIAPNIPTMVESGIGKFTVGLWTGLLAPVGTSRDVIDILARAGNESLKSEEVIKGLQSLGIDVVGSTPDEFSQFIGDELKRWSAVVASAGLRK